MTRSTPQGGAHAEPTHQPDPRERAVAAGAEVVHPLADQFYGERGGRVRDPFGHQWMLGHRIELLGADEMNRRAASFFSSET